MLTLATPWNRFKAHFQAWFKDHEVIRVLFRNFYPLSNDAYRSNQPSPSFVRKLKRKYGIKTIINLRSADNSGHYLLEKEACDQEGIKLEVLSMSSKQLPKTETILAAKALFESAEYPILIHCKSGADRAGLMSVYYQYFVAKEPIEKAVKQLSMKYGHFRWADTGKLDFFFDEFFKYKKQNPSIEFLEWVTTIYNRKELNSAFQSAGWANIVVNKILKRE